MRRATILVLAALLALAAPAAAGVHNLGVTVPMPGSLWNSTPLALDAAGTVYCVTDDALYRLQGTTFVTVLSGLRSEVWPEEEVGIDPSGFGVNAAGTLAYVATGMSGRVIEVDLAAPSARELSGAAMTSNYGLAVDPIHGKVFVTDSWTGSLYGVNTSGTGSLTLLKSFPGCWWGGGIAFRPTGELYVPIATGSNWPADTFPADLWRFNRAWLDAVAAGQTPPNEGERYAQNLGVSGTGFVAADAQGNAYLAAGDAIYQVDSAGNLSVLCGDPSINVFDWDQAGVGFMGLAFDPTGHRLLFSYRPSTSQDWKLHEYILPSTWTGSDDDHWDHAANWANALAPGQYSTAVLGQAGPVCATLYQDQAVCGLDLRAAGCTVGGTFTLSVGPDGLRSAGAGTSTIVPAVLLTAGATCTVGDGNTLSLGGGLDGGGHALVKDGGGTLITAGATNLAGLNLAGGTVVLSDAGGPKTLVTQGLTIAGGASPTATLDLGTGNAVIGYPDGGTSPMKDVLGWVKSGLSGGPNKHWDGPGITSSAARDDAGGLTALAVVDNNGIDIALDDLEGETLLGHEVLIKYTYLGDNDLNGTVDWDNDFLAFQNGALFGIQNDNAWLYGDYNYDGAVDWENDFLMFQNGILFQGGPLAGSGPGGVPEPATLALLAAGAAALWRRRRARR